MKTEQEIKRTIGESLMAGLYPNWREEVRTGHHDEWARTLPDDLHDWLSHSEDYTDTAAYLELLYANKASCITEAARKLAVVREHSAILRQQLEMSSAIEEALLFNITSRVH